MNSYILILLNERSRTDFLDQFHRLIQPFSNHTFLLYFTPSLPEIEAGIPFPFKQFQSKYTGKLKSINYETSFNEHQIDLIINLSGLDILDENLQNIPEIKSDFFSQLYMQFCPAIINGIINRRDTCNFQVTLRTADGMVSQLIQGNFKLLNYDYKKSLELIFLGNLHLLADGVKRYMNRQFGPTIQDKLHFEIVNPAKLQVLKRRLNQNKFKHRIRQLFYFDKWNIGIIDAPIEEVALQTGKIWEVKWKKELEKDDFIADPFGLDHKENNSIYVEQYINKKGNISTIQNSNTLETKLESNVHLSYPYTFSHEGKWYCLPEQSAANKIELFQINPISFILESPKEIISNFQAVDSSILFKDEQWFLFCTDASDKGADIRLHIFIADTLEGPYRPHQKNPVKSDIQSSRCAGKIFSKNGIFYRPSQNSSKTYGGEIIIQRIEILTESDYLEIEINRISPSHLKGNYDQGCHTLSSLGNRTLIDGKRNVFSLRNFFQKLRKKQNA
ncbi:MAG: hypothetical protein IPK10_11710 [Bacteroidetes bacterium]|nr:hypothetical protein [Bacteroidota bacterium]